MTKQPYQKEDRKSGNYEVFYSSTFSNNVFPKRINIWGKLAKASRFYSLSNIISKSEEPDRSTGASFRFLLPLSVELWFIREKEIDLYQILPI